MDKELLKKMFLEAMNQIGNPVPAQNIQKTVSQKPQVSSPGIAQPVQKSKVIIVNFDQNTKQPFQVKFSERGFSINGTRLSFELLDQALSKNFNIVLDSGNGLVLTPVRMQKIMKYKDLF